MAKLIPPTVHGGTKSPGEFEVFKRFETDSFFSDWTIFHSLDLPRHLTKVMGEIDFVILIPGLGVLCLSVKAHSRVERSQDGVWLLGSEPPCSEGPFKKARDDMFSLKKRLVDSVPRVAQVPFAFAVLFTHASPRDTLQPVEWNPDEQIFSRDFTGEEFGRHLSRCVINTRHRLGVSFSAVRPDSIDELSIVNYLRPKLELFLSPREREKATGKELKLYTEEQFAALDDAVLNRRMLYLGPAGTGKTLLAREVLRRERNESRNALLLCYNKLLSDALNNGAGENESKTQTIDALLLSIAGVPVPENAGQQFWDVELPSLALEKLLDAPARYQVESLVLDEAQDLLRTKYVDILDLLVIGGLAKGRWLMFGDFERQSIFVQDFDWKSFAQNNSAAIRSLRVNCRNPLKIAKYAEILGGLTPGYSSIRRRGDGSAPELHFYSDRATQEDALRQKLAEHEMSFHKRDIVILSPLRDADCCAKLLSATDQRNDMAPYGFAFNGIRYTTIHRFKGLESPAVIVTDVEKIGAEEKASLFYIAATRAIDRLTIIAHNDVRKEILSELLK
jgi:hypothetical protein